MQRLKILSVGKTKEKWLEDALSEYIKRLSPLVEIEFLWAKDDSHLTKLATNEKKVICLDPLGKQFDSKEFAEFIHDSFLRGGSRLALVIGGAEGLPPLLRKNYPLISLSKMTFTHQCTRLLLVEQIYRAFEISKGTKYHK